MSAELQPPAALGRRGLLAGAGVAALAAGALVTGSAQAAPPSGNGLAKRIKRHGSLGSAAVGFGSEPRSGYTYRNVTDLAFLPPDTSVVRQVGSIGAYTTTAAALFAMVDIPAGARVRDVELYAYNASSLSAGVQVARSSIAEGTYIQIGEGAIATGGTFSATRIEPAADDQGPFPVGNVLVIVITTTAGGTLQISGARVGFSQGGGQTGLLAAPSRVYDSRSGSKFEAGTTRTITLPASSFTPGTTGVLVNVAAVGAEKKGFLKVWSASESEPTASALNYNAAGDSIANAITAGVSAAGQLKIFSSQKTHVVVDLTGTVA